jgi:hypothetical protein
MVANPTKNELGISPDILEVVSDEEGFELFDETARFLTGMSGQEFLDRWDAGELDDRRDEPEIVHVAMLIPFARPSHCFS